MNDQIQQATDYIRRAMVQGVTEPEVRERLASSGWPQNLIDEGFLRYYSPTLPQAVPLPPEIARPARKSHKVLYNSIVAVVLLAAIIAGAFFFASHHSSNKKATPKPLDATTITKTPALSAEQIADNSGRKKDIAIITAAVSQFAAANNGNFPQQTATDATTANGLNICGADCADAGSVTAILAKYSNTAAAVSIKPFASDIKVPNIDTAYIVLGATCDGKKPKIGEATQFAVIYALTAKSGIEQNCTSS